jgi:FkbM family methyltransferase
VAQLGKNKRPKWMGHERAVFDDLQRVQLPALFEMYGVNCVIDVGAHEGEYAQRLRAGGYEGRIVSFEPVPRAFAELERAASEDPDWHIHPLALGREEAMTTMNAVPGTLSSLRAPTEFGARRYKRLRDPEPVDVQVRRLDGMLDELLRGLNRPRPYLKLDTQGFDLDVFAGAGDRIAEFAGMQSELALMQIYEGAPRLPEALALYEEAGFDVAAMYPVSRQGKTARVLEFDCVMVRGTLLKPSDS